MTELTDPVLLTIVACEIGFWVLVLGGLLLRYLARLSRTSMVVLALVPVLDVVLLAVVAIDLARGGEVAFAHRIAPIYLGATVMFGHRMIAWADVRFAHRFADGPPPTPIPKKGPVRRRHEWREFARWLGAAGISAAITALLGFTVADDAQREVMFGSFQMLGVVTVIWFVTGPVWTLGE